MKSVKRSLIIVCAVILSVLSVIPAFAITKKDVGSCKDYKWTFDEKELKWSCTDKFGNTISGWAVKEDDFYFFGKNGDMKTGWIKYKADGNWYYLYQAEDEVDKKDVGKMATNTWIDNYKVNDEGILVWTK